MTIDHHDKWIMLIRGECTAGYMGDILQYNWRHATPDGLYYQDNRWWRRGAGRKARRGAYSKTTIVLMQDAAKFELWLRRVRPALVEQFERAHAIVMLTNKPAQPAFVITGTQGGRTQSLVPNIQTQRQHLWEAYQQADAIRILSQPATQPEIRLVLGLGTGSGHGASFKWQRGSR